MTLYEVLKDGTAREIDRVAVGGNGGRKIANDPVDLPDDLPVGGLFGDGKKGLFLRCADGALEILELQAPGSKKLDGKAFLRGKNIVGSVLS